MTIELVKPLKLHFEGQVPEEDAAPWLTQDTSLCALPAGIYEIVYRRANYSYKGGGYGSNNYDYTEEVTIGILSPTSSISLTSDVELLKKTTRSYTAVMVPRKPSLPCKNEYAINYVPTPNLQYFSSFLVAVRAIIKGSPTYNELARILTAKGTGASATAIHAAGVKVPVVQDDNYGE